MPNTVTRMGYQMHEFQKSVAISIFIGHDVCLLAGTSSGKSLSFEAPMLVLQRKLGIVVAPINALMNAQVSVH